MGSLQDFEQRLENLYFKMTQWAVVLRMDSRKARIESGDHLRGPCNLYERVFVERLHWKWRSDQILDIF